MSSLSRKPARGNLTREAGEFRDTLNELGFFDLVRRRHSVRRYTGDAVSDEQLQMILEAANAAPSAGDLQAYQIVVIEDSESKAEIASACFEQEFIAFAPRVLVFCAEPQRSAEKYGERGAELYCVQDATIAAAYAELAIHALGLSTTWVGGFNEEELAEMIGCEKPICVLPIGHPAERAEPTPRRSLQDIVRRGARSGRA